jgi:maltose alpha-D-glucosyltransferase/alpha-amylase
MANDQPIRLEDDPLWFKDAIIYEAHVRAFFDSNADGIGDFRGMAEKLDYLEDLGITALWLLPFYPSPGRDDGYDIADYSQINPSYGTMRDFKDFLRESHRRGIRVINELVINHTSDQHPWFQRARRAKPGTSARDMYVWSDTPEKYEEARIIFKDFEPSNWSWDGEAQAYYWHRFFSHQPDLNFDNPRVHDAIIKLMEYWFKMGVDGMRLDAIPYLYERAGTNCENLPETHIFLKKLRAHIDANFSNRMLLAEANQWPEDTVPYFGNGDECHMGFHFPVMPRLFMSIRMEDRFPILDILKQTPAIPPTAQWAMFLRNHDELTLEMVTDEERDYMYRAYASDPNARINLGIRRRLAPLLGNDRRTIELMNSLLFALPGTPVLYYGDEIGMGDNIYLGDRNGVRTPMQWNGDRNAGFSRANPQQLYLPVIVDPEYHYQTVNVEAQQSNTNSLLWWMRRFTALRKQFQAFGRGTLEFLMPENRKVLAFVREYEDECILVVANLSRLVQYAELDLARFEGYTPVELFGRTDFPPIGDRPLFLTLGPHSFYWFSLEHSRSAATVAAPHHQQRPTLRVQDDWTLALRGGRSRFNGLLPEYVRGQRWFQSKARPIRSAHVSDVISLPNAEVEAALALVDIEYVEGEPETYVLPLAFARNSDAAEIRERHPASIIAQLVVEKGGQEEHGILYDALTEPAVATTLLDVVISKRRIAGSAGEFTGAPTSFLREKLRDANTLEAAALDVDQSNTSIRYGDALMMKVFRRLEGGTSLDLEVGRFLTEQNFKAVPRVAGALEYQRPGGEPRTIAVLQEYVSNEGNVWRYTLDALSTFYESLATIGDKAPDVRHSTVDLLRMARTEPDPLAINRIGAYLADAQLLGQRTAELHVTLGGGEDPAFQPERFTLFYQRSLYQTMRNLAGRTMQALERKLPTLPDDVRAIAQRIIDSEETLFKRYRAVIEKKINAVRIRAHGDYHLGQVLYTGRDFVITDFEGEPARALSERRLKRSPLLDVAGMIRSFDYAAHTALHGENVSAVVRSSDRAALSEWGRYWYASVAASFLRGYLVIAEPARLLPDEPQGLQVVLDSYLLDKAVYELGYELNTRPDWLRVPAEGLLQLLDG